MKRVNVIVMLLLAMFVGFSIMPGALAKSPDKGHAACMTECNTCASLCKKSKKYCESMGGKHADPKHLASFDECIKECQKSASAMKKNSEVAMSCADCAKACDACADSCETFKDDKTLKACAQECRKCSDECKKMAG